MSDELWWLWVLRMLVGVGLFLAGVWFGKTYGRWPMTRGPVPWTYDDLQQARAKMRRAGNNAFVEMTEREMAAYLEVSQWARQGGGL